MATPQLRYPICITIQVMYIPPPVGTNVNPLKRKFDDAQELANFVIWGALHEDLNTIWMRAEREYVKAYGKNKLDFKYFSRMRIRSADVFHYHKVSWFFHEGAKPGDNVLSFFQDDRDRESSIPVDSALRPKGFTLAKPAGNPLKRRKVHGTDNGMTVDEFDRDRPVESNEQPNDVSAAGDEDHVREPEVDKDGFKKPMLPTGNRKILTAKSRRTAQPHGTTQNAVLIPDSQPHNPPAEAQSAPAAHWLQSKEGARQQSAPPNHSSPTANAAARAKTVAPQPSQRSGAHTPSITATGSRKLGSNAGNAPKAILTPPSAEDALAKSQEAPTSAQPHASTRTPRSENAANYFRIGSRSNANVEDPNDQIEDENVVDEVDAVGGDINDDENLIDEDIDDEMLNEAYNNIAEEEEEEEEEEEDADYVPPGANGRGRTRSRSLESIPPQPNTTDAAEGPASQPTNNTSAPAAPAQSSSQLPSSSNAFETMRSSQTARSNSKSGKWVRAERIAVLKGAKQNLTVPQIIQKFRLERTDSAVRNCRKGLKTEFPGFKVPLGHDYYAEVEGSSAPVLDVVTAGYVVSDQAAAENVVTGGVPAENVVSAPPAPEVRESAKNNETPVDSVVQPTNKDEWSHAEVEILFDGVAAGLRPAEIKKDLLGDRPEAQIIQKAKEFWDTIVEREKNSVHWPHDDGSIHGWTDFHNLMLRRTIRDGLTAGEAWREWLGDFSFSTVQRKIDDYEAQLENPESRLSQRRRSPQVVIPVQRPSTASAGNTGRRTGNGGQTTLHRHFQRDKKKRAMGPAGAALRARINLEYGPQNRAVASGSGSGSASAWGPRRQPRASAAASAAAGEILQEISGLANTTHVDEDPAEEPEAMVVDSNLAEQDAEIEQDAEPGLSNDDGHDAPNDNIIPEAQAGDDDDDAMAEDEIIMMRQLDHAERTEIGTDPLMGAEHTAEFDNIVHEAEQAEAAKLESDPSSEEESGDMPTADAEPTEEVANAATAELCLPEGAELDSDAPSDAEQIDEANASTPESEDKEVEAEVITNAAAAAFAKHPDHDVAMTDASNSRPSTARSGPSKQLSQELQQSADSTPIPDVDKTPAQIVTAPHDLRTIIEGPDAYGIVAIGRPGFTTSMHKDNIETDEQILARCKRYYPKSDSLAHLKYTVDRLVVQQQIADDAKDQDEIDRFNKKLWPLKIFLLLKEQDDASVKGAEFNDWFARFGDDTDWQDACARGEAADEERGYMQLAMEEEMMENGGLFEGMEDYPDGVEHRGEIEEVDDVEDVEDVGDVNGLENVDEDDEVENFEDAEEVVEVQESKKSKKETVAETEESEEARKERKRLRKLAKAERRARRAEEKKHKRKHRKSKGESSRSGE